jgi:hypothetical protein
MAFANVDRGASAVTVSETSLPAGARALSTLSRIDYHDAFIVLAGVERTAEQWASAVLRDAPLPVRAQLVSGWLALGLELGPPGSARRVLGWKAARIDAGVVLLKADSWLGLHGELLFQSEAGGLRFATLVQHDNPAARGVWNAITPTHQAVGRSLLRHAAHARQSGRPSRPLRSAKANETA